MNHTWCAPGLKATVFPSDPKKSPEFTPLMSNSGWFQAVSDYNSGFFGGSWWLLLGALNLSWNRRGAGHRPAVALWHQSPLNSTSESYTPRISETAGNACISLFCLFSINKPHHSCPYAGCWEGKHSVDIWVGQSNMRQVTLPVTYCEMLDWVLSKGQCLFLMLGLFFWTWNTQAYIWTPSLSHELNRW